MKEDQKIHDALMRLYAEATPHHLPTSAEAWSRLKFRLAYRARSNNSSEKPGILMAALYVLAFLLWITWSGWLSVSLLAVLAVAAAASGWLLRHASRSF